MSSEFPGSTSAGSADEAAAKNPAFASALERARQVGRIQGCQMAKFGPFLSLDWARVEGVGAQSIAEPSSRSPKGQTHTILKIRL